MKKILIATAVFPPEPVVSASLMIDLAQELSSEYDVTVIRPRPTRPYGFDHAESSSYDNIKVITINDSYTCPKSSLFGRFRESISFGMKVVDYIKKNHDNIDLIYNAVWPLYGNKLVAKAARKYNIKYILSVQDIYPESILSKLPKLKIIQQIVNKLFLNIDIYSHQYAFAIHTISDRMADYLAESRGIERRKYRVVRNWQNADDFISYKQNNQCELKNHVPFTFMYMGNVGPLAGLEIVIQAFTNMKSIARLVIAGSGSAKESLMKMAISNPYIEFWDVPAGKVPNVQAKADVMILPIKKGFALSSIPSKLPAYMFSSKPVICAVDNNSDTAKCITEAGGGWVVEPENIEVLAMRLEECLNIPDESLVEMGARNFQYAIENFSRELGVKKLVSVFKEALYK